MEENLSISCREWHFSLPEPRRVYRGKEYRIGVGVKEADGKLIAVGEVFSADLDGCNPSKQICSSLSEAVKYVFGLGRAKA